MTQKRKLIVDIKEVKDRTKMLSWLQRTSLSSWKTVFPSVVQ